MKNYLFALFIVLSFYSHSQRNMTDSIVPTPLFGVQYGATWPAGDLSKRFGFMNQIGIAGGYKFPKNYYLGVNGDFLFGNQVKVPYLELFSHLTDSKGTFTDQNGDIATVLYFARGYQFGIEGGKVFEKLGHNKNSGLFVKVGLGYMSHKIRIESNDHVVPLVELDYRKGYDRLTTGLNLSQFIGYMFMSDNNFANFYVGFYIQEAFTKNRRPLFFDQPNTPVPTSTRLDLLYGVKFGWLIPVYKRVPKDFYYN